LGTLKATQNVMGIKRIEGAKGGEKWLSKKGWTCFATSAPKP
jgi:hypothetical protein